jgi:hypothetical protein
VADQDPVDPTPTDPVADQDPVDPTPTDPVADQDPIVDPEPTDPAPANPIQIVNCDPSTDITLTSSLANLTYQKALQKFEKKHLQVFKVPFNTLALQSSCNESLTLIYDASIKFEKGFSLVQSLQQAQSQASFITIDQSSKALVFVFQPSLIDDYKLNSEDDLIQCYTIHMIAYVEQYAKETLTTGQIIQVCITRALEQPKPAWLNTAPYFLGDPPIEMQFKYGEKISILMPPIV